MAIFIASSASPKGATPIPALAPSVARPGTDRPGRLLGWLTLPLAAAADSELSSQALLDYYLQQPQLLWLNLLAPVLLIWLLYFLIGRCWAAYLLTALPVLAIAWLTTTRCSCGATPCWPAT